MKRIFLPALIASFFFVGFVVKVSAEPVPQFVLKESCKKCSEKEMEIIRSFLSMVDSCHMSMKPQDIRFILKVFKREVGELVNKECFKTQEFKRLRKQNGSYKRMPEQMDVMFGIQEGFEEC